MSERLPVLLVVDGEPEAARAVREVAHRLGFGVSWCGDFDGALRHLRGARADVVVVDAGPAPGGAVERLEQIRAIDPGCGVVLFGRRPTPAAAVEAITRGAVDYLSTPFGAPALERVLRGVREEVARRDGLLAAEADIARSLECCGMVGRGPAMQRTFALVRRLAPHVRACLVTGEAGTGKELVARALHALGPRTTRPFVAADCGVPGDPDAAARLFGRADPSGAAREVLGLAEAANGGTLFLDDVAALSLQAQERLVRLLESGRLSRPESGELREADVVVVAATARDLRGLAAAGRFRHDLLKRLAVVSLVLPPLRDRREDIAYLTAAFVRDASTRLGKHVRGVTTAAEALLASAPWPGNVRELRGVVERACALAEGEFVTERDVALASQPVDRRADVPAGLLALPLGTDDAPPLLAAVEREHILRTLHRVGGNKQAAARMLGVSRRALYRRLERLDLGVTISRRPRAGDAVARREA